MLISQREACALLGTVGVARRHGLNVLASGLAGPAIRTRAALLYEEEAVRALVARPVLEPVHMWERSPAGFFIARRQVAVDLPRERLLKELAGGWDAISPWTHLELMWQVRHLVTNHQRGVPFVCTVSGFVVLGAEIVGSDRDGLVLADPGGWFDGLNEVRLLMGPGRPWSIYLGTAEDAPENDPDDAPLDQGTHERIGG